MGNAMLKDPDTSDASEAKLKEPYSSVLYAP